MGGDRLRLDQGHVVDEQAQSRIGNVLDRNTNDHRGRLRWRPRLFWYAVSPAQGVTRKYSSYLSDHRLSANLRVLDAGRSDHVQRKSPSTNSCEVRHLL